MTCKHEWIHKPGALKERCRLCGAARPYNPDRCDHKWKHPGDKKKERCVKCGAGRHKKIVIDDAVVKHTLEDKPSFLKKIMGRKSK